ncbi:MULTISPECIES: hypothetical protein [Streptomyces]|uniref:DUF4232 domain-containing protein n=1 Tax=Streptomyces lycii TaxID=2654337 RepID=A0ABQ7FSF3_9ACTN|nr:MULTISPECIES: hypothetical protein [Streptomyces]KAF4410959.1 hypothetical protein GCU69_00970 [Streptomyces lycii]PGH49593.1 hypothetical protein CRI70_16730 [Streptomyces sp. Ru87]
MTEQQHGADGPEGPDDFAGPRRSGEESPFVATDSNLDEQALKRLLQTVVDDIEPSPDSLEHLRRAVPARRARKRQAFVGGIAAVLFVGTAVPTFVHVASTGDTAEDRPANAASSERTQGGTGGKYDGDRNGNAPGAPGDESREKDGKKDPHDKGGKKGGEKSENGREGTAGGNSNPSETMAVSSPSCTSVQLGGGTSSVNAPDAEGKVYGSFRVVNVSDTACTVSGPGAVVATSQGNAEPIAVVDHTLGDAATGLPDPAAEAAKLILKPRQAYEVRFAFVPAGGSPGGCPTPGTSPDPGDSAGGSSGSPTTMSASESPQTTVDEQPPPAPAGSVLLSHTPEGDDAAVQATVPEVCSGTIYRTGVLTAS